MQFFVFKRMCSASENMNRENSEAVAALAKKRHNIAGSVSVDEKKAIIFRARAWV